MPRWDDLTQRALGTVDLTQGYLRKYKFGGLGSAESASLDDWSRLFDQRFWEIQSIENEFKSGRAKAEVAPKDEPYYITIHQNLDNTGRILQTLHSDYDYAELDRILRDFDRHLGHMITLHTHGSGEGEPNGPK
jgi:hypothetical protein